MLNKHFTIFNLQNYLFMASTSETGHAKNVANIEELVSLVTSMRPLYFCANVYPLRGCKQPRT